MPLTDSLVFANLAVIEIDWDLFFRRLFRVDLFWEAILTTIGVAVVVQILSTGVGVVSALSGMSRFRGLRLVARGYVLVVRAIPPLVTLFYVYYALPLLFGINLFPGEIFILGVEVSGAVLAAIVALTINEGAFNSEIIRAGISSVDPGQMDAAKVLGMRKRLAMRRIIFPQAIRIIIPPLGNQFNSLIKLTSLLALIGVHDMFQDASIAYATTFRPLEVFTAVALWYLLILSLWSVIQTRIEKRFARGFEPTSMPGKQQVLGRPTRDNEPAQTR